MAVTCDGCSTLLDAAAEDAALTVRDAAHRYRFGRGCGCAEAVLRPLETALLALRTDHSRRRMSRRATRLWEGPLALTTGR